MREYFFQYGPLPSSIATSQDTSSAMDGPGDMQEHFSQYDSSTYSSATTQETPTTGPSSSSAHEWPVDPATFSHGYVNQVGNTPIGTVEYLDPFVSSVGYRPPTNVRGSVTGPQGPQPRGPRANRGNNWGGHLSQGNRDSRVTHPARSVTPFQSTRGVRPLSRYQGGPARHHAQRGTSRGTQQSMPRHVDYYNNNTIPPIPHAGGEAPVQAPTQPSQPGRASAQDSTFRDEHNSLTGQDSGTSSLSPASARVAAPAAEHENPSAHRAKRL
ncbi:hypothetical protein CONLIGDRAFT_50808 [Coniochaeta ligniaria NRRL 30616]|uniref:Uncharacterized protein n=1 Tax=Coniochaeta ligniaria NRRL 30616 TaxID=1408157 RepID=A0A1J7JYR1_9PEZI|nr:hypothetical protein CONLIGDRAFT_50808 [Coniochaeta ligniaria NRRL 30616]